MPRFRSILLAATVFLAAPVIAAETLDPADEAFRAASYQQAWTAPIGTEQRWSNPASGHGGSVRPTKERIDPASRQPCREIREDVLAGDAPATGYAVGCRDSDGIWRIIQAGTVDPKPASHIVAADVTPYVAPADISADGTNNNKDALAGLPPQVRILVPWQGAAGAPPPAPH